MAPKRPVVTAPTEPGTVSAAMIDPHDDPGAEPNGVVPKVRRAVHDLRQPVQAMRLFVHLLSTKLERDEDRALVGKLDEALENIETALRGLMSSIASTAVAPSASDEPSPPAGA
jgi:hypothetical protein